MVLPWAGSHGAVQFMPQLFEPAVDETGILPYDLWNTREDYLSSAANYLVNRVGDHKYTWGVRSICRNIWRRMISANSSVLSE